VRLPAARRPCILLQNAPPVRACCPDKGTPVALLNCSLPLCGAGLKKFLKKHAEGDTLAVLDAKLGSLIKEKLGINCLYSSGVMELTRGIRNQLTSLVAGLSAQDLRPMSLGLSHSLSRYKLKFSPDKVDTMIVQVSGGLGAGGAATCQGAVSWGCAAALADPAAPRHPHRAAPPRPGPCCPQAIGLLDDLDKELNTYAMRVREWYGWHFPEMTKIVTDNIAYAKTGGRGGRPAPAAGHWSGGEGQRGAAGHAHRPACSPARVLLGWLTAPPARWPRVCSEADGHAGQGRRHRLLRRAGGGGGEPAEGGG
jgi:hypothetical protein